MKFVVIVLCLICTTHLTSAAANLKNLDTLMRKVCIRQYKDEICENVLFKNITEVNQPYCKNGQCADIKYGVIERLYKGMFYTQGEIMKLERIFSKRNQPQKRDIDIVPPWEIQSLENLIKRNEKRAENNDHDGDKCCPTRHHFFIHNSTLQNIYGVNRTIVQMYDRHPEPLYQIVHTGECVSGGNCLNCQLEQKLITLLVIDPDATCWPPLLFEQFNIDSYCSCKDIDI